MQRRTVLDGIEVDLQQIVDWAQAELAYVRGGLLEHPSDEDLVDYYRYIRKVRCST